MILQPVIPLVLLLPLLLIMLAVVMRLCYMACKSLIWLCRWGCVLLSALSTLSVSLLLLNPVHMQDKPTENAPVWLVGVDCSSSMAAPLTNDASAPSRFSQTSIALEQLSRVADRQIMWCALGKSLRIVDSSETLASQSPIADASHIMQGLSELIEAQLRKGKTIGGVIVMSDGRESNRSAANSLIAKATTAGCSVHVLPLGEQWQNPDISVSTYHPLVHTYPGVETHLKATVSNVKMGERQLHAELLDSQQQVLETKVVTSESNAETEISFAVKEDKQGEFFIRVSPQSGESRADNNSVRIVLRAVDTRIRVLMAEGSPYWDSKFLAQYLRAQQVFDVRSVHRLSDKRFYHINSGDDDSTPSESHQIPTTEEDFARFDIVVLGKGMEHFFNEESAAALRSYVREHGGILVLSRGACSASELTALQELDPFVRTTSTPIESAFIPSDAGRDMGLFGLLLPDGEDKVWTQLPVLEDVYEIDSCRPGTAVLAHAQNGKIPMLGLMRYGLGTVAALNGEGLWKWDFYPEARAFGNLYRDFWRYFLPWVQTSAEFMPGFDLSLHVKRATLRMGETAECRLSWRGIGRPNQVTVNVVSLSDGSNIGTYVAVPSPSGTLPVWECTIPRMPAGEYLLQATAGTENVQSPECRICVKGELLEQENLNADAELLSSVAQQTSGLVLSTQLTDAQLQKIFALPSGVQATEQIVTPCWNAWWILALIGLNLGVLWFVRRRKGLP